MPQAAVAQRTAPAPPPLQLHLPLAPVVAPQGIDLGSCVLVSLLGDWNRSDCTEEGVVIEVVPPGGFVRSARVVDHHPGKHSRSVVTRYVVQCWTRRVIRRAVELELVCH